VLTPKFRQESVFHSKSQNFLIFLEQFRKHNPKSTHLPGYYTPPSLRFEAHGGDALQAVGRPAVFLFEILRPPEGGLHSGGKSHHPGRGVYSVFWSLVLLTKDFKCFRLLGDFSKLLGLNMRFFSLFCVFPILFFHSSKFWILGKIKILKIRKWKCSNKNVLSKKQNSKSLKQIEKFWFLIEKSDSWRNLVVYEKSSKNMAWRRLFGPAAFLCEDVVSAVS